AARALDLGATDARLDDPDDGLRHLVLEIEDVVQYAVIFVGPEMAAGFGLDQLSRDAYALAALAHATLQHVADAELAPDLLDVDGFALVGEARIPRDHEQPVDPRQTGDDVLDHTIGEVFLIGIAADVLEGQHRYRRLVGQRHRRLGRFRRVRQVDPIDTHRARDVLERLLAQVYEGLRQLVADLTPGVLRKADAARLRDAFEPRRDVDGVAEQVVAIDHDIPQVNPDPERHTAVAGDLGIAPRHSALHFQRAAPGVDDARKFGEDAVAGGLDDATAMDRDSRVDQLHPYGVQLRERAFFVDADQAAIAGDIRRQHRREPAFDALGVHRPAVPARERPILPIHGRATNRPPASRRRLRERRG